MTSLEDLIVAIRANRSPPENWTHYNDGFNQGLEVAIADVVRALQTEPATGEFICKKCGLRTDGEKIDADF